MTQWTESTIQSNNWFKNKNIEQSITATYDTLGETYDDPNVFYDGYDPSLGLPNDDLPGGISNWSEANKNNTNWS